jgi:two-component system cell cycle sensor histidine kinase/response regulator CckA
VLAYSEPGRGTTVKVYLPRAEGVAAATTREESPPLRAGLETVLVVEDDEVIRRVARRVLEMQSYTVLVASTPTEALEVAAQFEGRIDLLLTDVILPGVTGPRLAELLLFGRPGLPVLYMSGYADDAIVRSGQLAPDTEFLSKPFTPEALLRRVRQALDQHGADGAVASA